MATLTKLVQAAWNANVPQVQEFLQELTTINEDATGKDSKKNKNKKNKKNKNNKKVTVNDTDPRTGCTPLVAAVCGQKKKEEKTKQQKGNNRSHDPQEEEEEITEATARVTVLQLLLEAGADANQNCVTAAAASPVTSSPHNLFRSPLQHACRLHRIELARLLLAFGARVFVMQEENDDENEKKQDEEDPFSDRQNVLHLAVESWTMLHAYDFHSSSNETTNDNGDVQLVDMLLTACQEQQQQQEGSSQDHVAKLLSARNSQGMTPLMSAIESGCSAACIRRLLGFSNDDNNNNNNNHYSKDILPIKDEHGRTPLVVACVMGHVDAVNVLLDAANTTTSMADSGEAATVTTTSDHDKNKEDDEQKNSDGVMMSPLHWAMASNQFAVVQLLLNKGVVDNNNNNNTNSKSHSEYQILLEQPDHLGRTPLFLPCAMGRVDFVGALLEKGAQIFVDDHQGKTPMHWAMDNQHFDVFKVLVLASLAQRRQQDH